MQEGPTDAFTDAKFSPDGRFVGVCCTLEAKRRWVHIWNLQTGALHKSLAFDQVPWRTPTIAWSARGRYVAISQDHQLDVWETRTGRHIVRQPSFTIYEQFAFSPDESRLAWANTIGTAVVVELPGGRTLRTAQTHSSASTVLKVLAWSPDSKHLLIGATLGSPRIWSRDGALIDIAATSYDVLGQEWAWMDSSHFLQWDASGAIARTRIDATGKVIDGPTVVRAATRPRYHRVAVSHHQFATVDNSGKLTLWDTRPMRPRTQELLAPLPEKARVDVSFSSDGAQLVTMRKEQVHLHQLATGQHLELPPIGPPAEHHDAEQEEPSTTDLHHTVVAWRDRRLWISSHRGNARHLSAWSSLPGERNHVAIHADDTADVSPDGNVVAIARGDVVLLRPDDGHTLRLGVRRTGHAFVPRVAAATIRAFVGGLRLPPQDATLSGGHHDGGPIIEGREFSPHATGLALGFESEELAPTDLGVLAKLPKLQHLHLSTPVLAHLNTLPALPRLTSIGLGFWGHTDPPAKVDLTPLTQAPAIESIHIGAVVVDDLRALGKLPKLRELSCMGCTMTNWTPLHKLASLQELTIIIRTPRDKADVAALQKARPDLTIHTW